MKKSVKIVLLSVVSAILVVLTVLLSSRYFSSLNVSKSQKNETNSDKLLLGFSQIGSESAWRTRNTASIFEAAQQNNIQIIYDDAQQKQINQLKAIRSFIVYQVDVIAFVPIVEDGWDNVLQEAKEANIPVIIVDRQINADPSLYAGYLGENAFMEGEQAGRFLERKCKSLEKAEVNILEVAGTSKSSVATGRAEGFRKVIASDSKFKILYSEDGDFLRSKGKEIIDNIIEENKGLFLNGEKIDVIYSHNDSMTLGILDSLREHQISSSSIIIISIDGEQKCIDALVEGRINCVVECNPNCGNTLMALVKQVASGESIPAVSYMQESVFTEDDDFSTYMPRGY